MNPGNAPMGGERRQKPRIKRIMNDPEMGWQPSIKMYWCAVCQIMHPHFFKCRRAKDERC